MQYASYKRYFQLSHPVIWGGALCMGILASIPKMVQHMEAGELLIDISITSLFTVAAWYYHLYSLPAYPVKATPLPFAGVRLFKSLGLGLLLMAGLVVVHQWLAPQYPFQSIILPYECRGLVINLIVYLFLYLLYQSQVHTRMQLEMEQIQSGKLAAQLGLLQQQVNPHFLCNSLNTLKSMVEVQDTQAPHFIGTLSDFYHTALEKQQEPLIPVPTEIRTLETYLHLLKYRFEENIDVFINLCAAHQQSMIPPFTLQLLIENCIKHNIVSPEKPLYISIYSDGDHITVENRLQLKSSAAPATPIDLAHISQRYQHLLGEPIQVEQNEQSFLVKLPVSAPALANTQPVLV